MVKASLFAGYSWFEGVDTYLKVNSVEFGILILVWIWFDTPMNQTFGLNLDFEGANNTHVL